MTSHTNRKAIHNHYIDQNFAWTPNVTVLFLRTNTIPNLEYRIA